MINDSKWIRDIWSLYIINDIKITITMITNLYTPNKEKGVTDWNYIEIFIMCSHCLLCKFFFRLFCQKNTCRISWNFQSFFCVKKNFFFFVNSTNTNLPNEWIELNWNWKITTTSTLIIMMMMMMKTFWIITTVTPTQKNFLFLSSTIFWRINQFWAS